MVHDGENMYIIVSKSTSRGVGEMWIQIVCPEFKLHFNIQKQW